LLEVFIHILAQLALEGIFDQYLAFAEFFEEVILFGCDHGLLALDSLEFVYDFPRSEDICDL
jgi:hypothetical protein